MDTHSDLLACPLCHRNYSISGCNASCRFPILLKCKHSICEYCFREEVKNRRQVTCRRCNFASPIVRNARGKDNIEDYPIHFYIAGVMMQEKLNSMRSTESVEKIKFEVDQSKSSEKACDKCGKDEASVKCDECEDCFCDRCDVDIHTITTGARKHSRKRISSTPISIAVLESQFQNCELHNIKITYNCKDCDVKVCSDCVLQSHKDHSYEAIVQSNKIVLNKTLELIDKAQDFLPRFSYSQSKINEVYSKIETKLSFNPKFSKTFEILFGSMQWCEIENRLKLKQFLNDQSEMLKKYATELFKRIEHIKEFVKLKAVLNETYLEGNKINLNETVSLLETTISAPWFIPNEIFEAIDNFIFEKYNQEMSEKFVELNLSEFPQLTLKCTEEVSENDLEHIDTTVKKNELAKSRSIVSPDNDTERLSVTSHQSSETNGSFGSRKPKKKTWKHDKGGPMYSPTTARNSEVSVCHMKSPASFYVHLLKNNSIFSKLKNICENWASKTSFVSEVKRNVYYLTVALNEQNQKEWRRVQVEDFKEDGNIKVKFVDYGYSSVVSREHLKNSSESIRKLLPFAFQCRLADVFPKTRNWTALDTQQVMKIIKSYEQLYLKVIRKLDNSFVVDLLMNSENLGSRADSLQDILLHSQKSAMFNNASKHPDKTVNVISDSESDAEKKPKVVNVESESDEDNGDVSGCVRLEVTILKSDSPNNITYSLPHLHLELNEMSKDIQDFYSNSANLMPLEGDELKIGTLCLAHFKRTNKWCRAKVQKMDFMRECVAVNFFDEGTKEEISMSKVYKLDHRFSLSHSRAMHAYIGGIRPPCEKDAWPKIVCERLEKLLTDNRIYMSKMSNAAEDEADKGPENLLAADFWFKDCIELDALAPSVFEWKSVRDILIKEGLACEDHNFKPAPSAATFQETVIACNAKKPSPTVVRIDDDLEMLVEDESEENINTIRTKMFWLPASRPKLPIFETIPRYIDMKGFIYIHDLNEGPKNMAEIRAEFNSKFKKFSNATKTEWSVGEICSALYFSDNQYHRAEVVGIDTTGNFLVEFVDYGNTETCTYSDLREYVCAHHIPKQVCKCRHKDLEPLLSPFENNEEKLKDILDIVHSLIVETTVTAEYICDVGGYPLIDICCLGEKLVDKVKEEIDSLKIREGKKYLLVEVDDCEVQIKFTYFISGSDAIVELPKPYMMYIEEFEELQENLQFISRNLNEMSEIIVDKPCVSYDYGTKKWQRAKIFKKINNFKGSVMVYFVDKGTISEVDKSLIRETRDDLMKLPVKTCICTLSNLRNPKTGEPINSLMQIKQCFNTNDEYDAVIKDKSKEGVLRIEISSKNRSLDLSFKE